MTVAVGLVSDVDMWHVVHTKPREEFRALENLENQGYVCFLPTLRIHKMRRNLVEIAIEPLFSRYLFIQLNAATSNWYPIRSTRGVSSLLMFGGQFATLPQPCVESMRRRCEGDAAPLFIRGDRVEITSGPLAGLQGVYELADGEVRALVLIELMRTTQSLKLPVTALRKVA
jgi:transcriptional antiterminator RfaH